VAKVLGTKNIFCKNFPGRKDRSRRKPPVINHYSSRSNRKIFALKNFLAGSFGLIKKIFKNFSRMKIILPEIFETPNS